MTRDRRPPPEGARFNVPGWNPDADSEAPSYLNEVDDLLKLKAEQDQAIKRLEAEKRQLNEKLAQWAAAHKKLEQKNGTLEAEASLLRAKMATFDRREAELIKDHETRENKLRSSLNKLISGCELLEEQMTEKAKELNEAAKLAELEETKSDNEKEALRRELSILKAQIYDRLRTNRWGWLSSLIPRKFRRKKPDGLSAEISSVPKALTVLSPDVSWDYRSNNRKLNCNFMLNNNMINADVTSIRFDAVVNFKDEYELARDYLVSGVRVSAQSRASVKFQLERHPTAYPGQFPRITITLHSVEIEGLGITNLDSIEYRPGTESADHVYSSR